jgi:hypothetical protein
MPKNENDKGFSIPSLFITSTLFRSLFITFLFLLSILSLIITSTTKKFCISPQKLRHLGFWWEGGVFSEKTGTLWYVNDSDSDSTDHIVDDVLLPVVLGQPVEDRDEAEDGIDDSATAHARLAAFLYLMLHLGHALRVLR